jgi:hypothetical protein
MRKRTNFRLIKPFKYLSILFLLVTCSMDIALAEFNLRKCLLLPVTDHINGSLGEKIFAEVESYLESSTWCQYKSNSEIFNILLQYRENLPVHLQNPEIIKELSAKTKTGSVLRISVQGATKGLVLNLDVLNETGDSLYFSESAVVEKDDPTWIGQIVSNWLQQYQTHIPFTGIIQGIIGNEITIEVPENLEIQSYDEFDIIRPIKKKKHPLLSKIVAWDTLDLASAKVTKVSRNKVKAFINKDTVKGPIIIGDWVRIKLYSTSQKEKNQTDNTINFSDDENNINETESNFGKIGEFTFGPTKGTGSGKNSIVSVNHNLEGELLGFKGEVKIYVTRNYWGQVQYSQWSSDYKKKSGTFTDDNIGVEKITNKINAGYKYLPFGYFYGPSVDIFGGLSSHKYNMVKSLNAGTGSATFTGFNLGLIGSIPIMSHWRIFAIAEMIPFANYTDKDELITEEVKASQYEFKLGGSYEINRKIGIDLAYSQNIINLSSNQTSQDANSKRSLKYKESQFSADLRFSF